MSWHSRLKASQAVVMIVIGGVLAFFIPVYAVDILLDDNTSPYSDTTCYDFTNNSLTTCGSSPSISETKYFGQVLDLKEGEEITSITLYSSGTPHGQNKHQLFILDNDQFNHFKTSGQLTVLATSTERIDFGSFTISYEMTPDVSLPLRIIVKNWSTYPGMGTATDLVVLRPDSYPRRTNAYYNPSSLASAFGTDYLDLDNGMDLHISVYTPEENLSFKRPQFSGQTLFGTDIYRSFELYGSCSEDFQLRFFSIATGLDKYYLMTCSTTISYWELEGQNLPDGYYSLRASSTNNSQIASGFFFVDTYASTTVASTTPYFSDLYDKINTWSCPVPYLDSFDVCATIGDMITSMIDALSNGVKNTYGAFRNAKPYAYIFDLSDTFTTALETTTSTVPLATFVVPTSTNFLNTKFQGTFHFFDSTTLTSLLSESQWSVIRAFLSVFLYVLFGTWLYRRIIKLV